MLRLADPEERYAAVRLRSDLPGTLEYRRDGEDWTLDVGARVGGTVSRLEYELELVHADGGSEWVCDPENPLRAPGAFGEKSVLLLEGYEPPPWLGEPQAEGGLRELTAPGRGLGRDVAVALWSPADAEDGDPLPLLVANDGPEYAELAGLTDYCAAMIAERDAAAPPRRAAGARAAQRVVLRLAAVCGCAGARRAAGGGRRGGRGRGAGGDGRLARRARDAARRAPPPGRVRRAVPAVGQLLHAASTTSRSAASPAGRA